MCYKPHLSRDTWGFLVKTSAMFICVFKAGSTHVNIFELQRLRWNFTNSPLKKRVHLIFKWIIISLTITFTFLSDFYTSSESAGEQQPGGRKDRDWGACSRPAFCFALSVQFAYHTDQALGCFKGGSVILAWEQASLSKFHINLTGYLSVVDFNGNRKS